MWHGGYPRPGTLCTAPVTSHNAAAPPLSRLIIVMWEWDWRWYAAFRGVPSSCCNIQRVYPPPIWLLCGREVPYPMNTFCAWMEWSSLHIWRGMRSTKWHESVRRRWEYFQQYQYCYWLAETEGRSLAHNSCYFVNNRYNGRIRNLDKHIFPIDNLLSLLYLCIDVASIAREADRIAREVRENDGHWRE